MTTNSFSFNSQSQVWEVELALSDFVGSSLSGKQLKAIALHLLQTVWQQGDNGVGYSIKRFASFSKPEIDVLIKRYTF